MIRVEYVIDLHEGNHAVSYYLYDFDFYEFSVFVCTYVLSHIQQEYVCTWYVIIKFDFYEFSVFVCTYVLSHIQQEYVCTWYVIIKLHITAQSGPVIPHSMLLHVTHMGVPYRKHILG